jgi:endogenous inhibitor of DNA gyrase (YacG/DUF329 family)
MNPESNALKKNGCAEGTHATLDSNRNALKKNLISQPQNPRNISKPSITADGIANKMGEWKVIQRINFSNKSIILYSSKNNKFKVQIFDDKEEIWKNFNNISRVQDFIHRNSRINYLRARIEKCLNCEKDFKHPNRLYKFCSKKCKKAYYQSHADEIKAKKKEYYQRPEIKAKNKEYYQRPEIKAKMKAYYQKPEIKAKKKEYRQRPEIKAKMKAYMRKYMRTYSKKAGGLFS